jgi:solute carrier family 25 carnitine/acylcarnitine transporter 20/29
MHQQEGMFAYYKGLAWPLYSIPMVNAIVFAGYESAKKMMNIARGKEMTIWEGLAAGAWAGLVNCIIVTPVEMVKIQQQMEGIGSMEQQTPATKVAKNLYRYKGFRTLYKANYVTVLREVCGWAAQFAAYEGARNGLTKFAGQGSTVIDFFSGGFSGLVGWVFQYPQDIIKTKIQMDVYGAQYKNHRILRDGGTVDCAKEIWRKDGWRGFWVGFSACATRAFIANAFTFLAYEQAKKYLF